LPLHDLLARLINRFGLFLPVLSAIHRLVAMKIDHATPS
jgi:hypothetical protein